MGNNSKEMDPTQKSDKPKEVLDSEAENAEREALNEKHAQLATLQEDLAKLEEEIQEKLKLAEQMRENLNKITKVDTLVKSEANNSDYAPTLRPKDVINWVSTFNGSGNVKIFLREVQDALSQMGNWLDEKCVLRMIIANKITGQAKELIGSQEADTWEDIQDLLRYYYDVQDMPYTHLKEQRNKTMQGREESVSSYAKRFLDVHRRVIRAAGNKADPQRAKFAQEAEEEEGIWRFTVGLSDKICERVETKTPRTIKEAISYALNAETLIQERNLCRKTASTRYENRFAYQEDRNFRAARHNATHQRTEERKITSRRENTPTENREGRPVQQSERNSHQRYEEKRPIYQSHERRRSSSFCDFCKRSGHDESRCYSKNRSSDFRQGQGRNQPPPIRTLQEKANESDPFEYESSTAATRSCTSDPEESDEQ